MITLADKKNDIIDLLSESTESHLADCIDMVPDANIEALYEMMKHQRGQRIYKSMIRQNVVQDVAAILEGKPGNAIFSNPFLANEN